ncbi:hypothetical protein FE251_07560 [Georgenia wutianyii]|uniref:FUSC family protein n=1 Tax=Georgenia wutianyii TaxID=2585135 RepID=A0ABX5VMS2_9MICO|nr:hypothetical protein FE251_07560 [Georgenia wutianyii]
MTFAWQRVALPRDVRSASWWRERWRRNPRLALAIRAALAAAIAWAAVGLLPGPAADYPYYAPFGAVIATTFTLAGSVRESLQSVLAIVVGGAVGWAVDLLPATGPAAVALVVVPSVVLAGWRLLGSMGSWVPTAALFTLIVGHGEEMYVGAYAGLTLFGAVIGILVNAVLPPLPLAPAQATIARFRATLAGDVAALAALLDGEELPSLREWDDEHAVAPRERAAMAAAVTEVGEAARRNPRARRYTASIQALRYEARTLDRLSLVVSDLADLLLGGVGDTDRVEALSGGTRELVRDALGTIAAALENVTDAGTESVEGGPPSSREAHRAVEEARRIAPRRDDQLLVDSVLVSLRRASDSLAQMERTD